MKAFAYEIFTTKGITPSTTIIKAEPSSEKEFTARSIFFKFNSADIEIEDIPYIHQLIDHLRADERLNLELNGYSDGIGSYKINMEISVKRVERIKSYLVKFGINESRIKTTGFGHLKNKKGDTFQYNRRVEIILK
jgi:outer membrane protein OmpA-like peptidoglycan-associated protein